MVVVCELLVVFSWAMLPQEFNPLETPLKASVCKTENQQDQDQSAAVLHASEADVGRSPPLWHVSEAEVGRSSLLWHASEAEATWNGVAWHASEVVACFFDVAPSLEASASWRWL